MFDLLLVILLTTLTFASLIANVLGMPGNWVVVIMAGLCLWLSPAEQMSHVGWGPFLAILVIALFGEILEFAAGAMGASRMGGSRRGTVLAIVGSIGGAITGLFCGAIIPIPIIGPVIGSLLLGAGGAFAGAITGERWAGKDWDASIEIGNAAFWGRLLGTVGKAVCGTVASCIFVIAIWF